MLASKAQIGAIHALKAQVGLDDDAYRDMLQQQAGQRSAKGLRVEQAGRVIQHLQGLADGNGALDLDGPYVAIARALWISGYHLGVVRNRSDRALVTWIKRQTHIDHANWVHNPAHGSAVVDGLKAWLARDGGVAWPSGKADTPGARQYAVMAAQRRRLGWSGAPLTQLPSVTAEISRMGRLIRQQLGGGK